MDMSTLVNGDRKRFFIKRAHNLIITHKNNLFDAVNEFTRREWRRRRERRVALSERGPSTPTRLVRRQIFREDSPCLRYPLPHRPTLPPPDFSPWENITTPWDNVDLPPIAPAVEVRPEVFKTENPTPVLGPPPASLMYPDSGDWHKTLPDTTFPPEDPANPIELLDSDNVDPPDYEVYILNMYNNGGGFNPFVLSKSHHRYTKAPWCNKALHLLGDLRYPVIEGPLLPGDRTSTDAVIYKEITN